MYTLVGKGFTGDIMLYARKHGCGFGFGCGCGAAPRQFLKK